MHAPRLYLVTDRNGTRGRRLTDVVEAALRGGVDAVQLREKDLTARELLELAREIRVLCTTHGARLLINDRVDVALAAGADGVHLPVSSFRVADARLLLGRDKMIGASTHNLAEASAAQRDGADFVVFGPIFDTPSKRVFGEPVGLDALRELTRRVHVPVLAIGGVTPATVGQVHDRGAFGVAVISGILGADDPEAAAAACRTHLQRYVGQR
jgi:thiamine-phosphate pyrophosphorylase